MSKVGLMFQTLSYVYHNIVKPLKNLAPSAKKSDPFFMKFNSKWMDRESAFDFKGQKSQEKTMSISFP